ALGRGPAVHRRGGQSAVRVDEDRGACARVGHGRSHRVRHAVGAGGGRMTAAASPLAALAILLRALKLPTIARHAEEIAQVAEREGWSFVRYLHHLVELEVHERRRRRIERNLRQSELPPDKTLATLTRSRLPAKVAKQLPTLCEGAFLARGD